MAGDRRRGELSPESVRAVSRWTVRVIPFVLSGCVGFATYVVVDRICVDYLMRTSSQIGAAIVILVLYFVLFLLVLATYLRTFLIIQFDPGVVPYGPEPYESKRDRRRRMRGEKSDASPRELRSERDPDSPGLEEFYRRDVFVCENDGLPRFCSECRAWKPDRAHHSSELNRCVYKMDHFCPWVGGIVSENSFKFFVQFCMWASFYCALALATAAYHTNQLVQRRGFPDGQVLAVIALSGFFGLFTCAMWLTSLRYVFINQTNVDVLSARKKVYQLAVRVPLGTPSTAMYSTVTYPLARDGQTTGGRQGRPGPSESASSNEAPSAKELRDMKAARTFAIVRTEPGENPWDLGWYRNWESVMGTNVFDWFLPLHRSPCTDHGSTRSMYRMGKVLSKVKHRYGLDNLPERLEGFERRNVGSMV